MDDTTTSGAPGGASAIPLSPDQPHAGAPAAPRGEAPAEQAAPTAQSLVGQAKQKLTGTLDGQKGAAADLVEQFAQSLQRSGEQFAGKQDWIASAVGRGAAELNSFAETLRDKDLGELVRDVQSFAQRQPGLFVGAALAAGFAVARLGKVVAGDLSRDDLPTIPEVGHGQH